MERYDTTWYGLLLRHFRSPRKNGGGRWERAAEGKRGRRDTVVNNQVNPTPRLRYLTQWGRSLTYISNC
jgi:hypothetical protein